MLFAQVWAEVIIDWMGNPVAFTNKKRQLTLVNAAKELRSKGLISFFEITTSTEISAGVMLHCWDQWPPEALGKHGGYKDTLRAGENPLLWEARQERS